MPDVDFDAPIVALLTGFLTQNGETAEAAALDGIAARLRLLVDRHGFPAPVTAEAESVVSRPADAEFAARAAFAAGSDASPLLLDATRQLVKALFYPELRQCRLSFEAVSADGACRRQELPRVRRRISGAHCVDCPHWRALAPDAHRAFLARHWRGDPAEFSCHTDVFLPEDFRALRRLIAATRQA